LKDLKTHTKLWVKEIKSRGLKHEEELEGKIKETLQMLMGGTMLPEVESSLINLEFERNKYLKAKEELWRQRSRAIWVQSGDQNMKFFHQFASHRRNIKHIWEIRDDTGTAHCGQESIKEEAVKYYKNFFKSLDQSHPSDQVRVAGLFSCLINEEEARVLHRPVKLEELKEVLSLFKKEKIPRPDGRMVEFFIHFFDLVGEDLLAMVEESRSRGYIAGSLNSIFLALIPKVNKHATSRDFKPISLCNLVYKFISKIIANHIKLILSKSLSIEQLEFLEGRQIQDAIGTTHEFLHNIKKKNCKSLILKLDLQKAYDCINWDSLRMILIQVGFWQSIDKLDYELCGVNVFCCFN
jgi:hypothetical protein